MTTLSMNFTYLRKNVRFPRFLVVLVRTQKKKKGKIGVMEGWGLGMVYGYG